MSPRKTKRLLDLRRIASILKKVQNVVSRVENAQAMPQFARKDTNRSLLLLWVISIQQLTQIVSFKPARHLSTP
jgi:hypothetical protein